MRTPLESLDSERSRADWVALRYRCAFSDAVLVRIDSDTPGGPLFPDEKDFSTRLLVGARRQLP
jgi:hypothetical protein